MANDFSNISPICMSTGILRISLRNIAQNWTMLNALSAPDVETGAVLKADGYSLGASEIGKSLFQHGVRSFFVARPDEGIQLRNSIGKNAKIYLFSGHTEYSTEIINDAVLIPFLNSPKQFFRHLKNLPNAPFAIQLDTGMSRLGFMPSDWIKHKNEILNASPCMIMSHLACADTPEHPMNESQRRNFIAMTDGTNIPRSLAATGGILLGQEYHFDLVRPGIGLYGAQPFGQGKDTLILSLPVIQTRTIPKGAQVGYGGAWTAPKESTIATISAGYADGITRILQDRLELWAGQIACPILGRISMDVVCVDISALDKKPKYLDLISPYQSIDDIAEKAHTISYEILTSLGTRFRHIYDNTIAEQ